MANKKPQHRYRKGVAKQIGKAISAAHKIGIVTHRNPDGDAIGSSLGLRLLLEQLNKQVTNICIDPVPTAFQFLPASNTLVNQLNPQAFDLIITVDVATKAQTGFDEDLPELFDGSVPLINIDHHPTNEVFGMANLIAPEMASATMMLLSLAEQLKWSITPEIATCLLTGLFTDTGSFMHSNTTPAVYRTTAQLLSYGADLDAIRSHTYGTTPVSTLRLWGSVLERMELDDESGAAISIIREDDFERSGAQPKDTAGAIDYLNMTRHAKCALLLTEIKGRVKGSLRTKEEDVDVAALAGRFGGGGHVKAAGFSVPGSLKVEKRYQIVKDN